jgi:hypothetical protein
MRLRGTLAVDNPHAIVVRGTHAFVATEGGVDPAGLRIIDVSNADAPVQIGKYTGCENAQGNAVDADADGRTIYLGCSDGSLRVLDASNAAAPSLVGTYLLMYADDAVTAVTAQGNTIYVGHGAGVDEVDVSDPSTPTLLRLDTTLDVVTSLTVSPNGSLYAFAGVAGTYLFAPAPSVRAHSTHARRPHAPAGDR